MCFYPLKAWKPLAGGRLDFKGPKDFWNYEPVEVPCGRCLQCRMKYSKEWATRCVLESSLYEKNCFITLTYNDENLPENNTLVKRDLQLFMKRLRKMYGAGIRFYACGEYGSLNKRPHYHLLLFNFDFPDKVIWRGKSLKQNDILYRSASLEKLWTYGFSTVGAVTYESAAYVSRYILKKQRGKTSHYYKDHNIIPEYTVMSRKPGIAQEWFEKYHTDVYSRDFIQVSEKIKAQPPRYFDILFAKAHGEDTLASIKANRQLKAEEAQLKKPEEFTHQRQAAKQKSFEIKVGKLIRPIEGEIQK